MARTFGGETSPPCRHTHLRAALTGALSEWRAGGAACAAARGRGGPERACALAGAIVGGRGWARDGARPASPSGTAAHAPARGNRAYDVVCARERARAQADQ